MKILRTASLESNFTGSYKKKSVGGDAQIFLNMIKLPFSQQEHLQIFPSALTK